eukprot:GHVN01057902.1.p1 GENE.GHVN01057902.1~~GHVN01057902.1.p1  ORF type:complete len:769 (-),score=101.32 GHVN01057902.1:2123-4429(-)
METDSPPDPSDRESQNGESFEGNAAVPHDAASEYDQRVFDTSQTFQEFGCEHFDRRITSAISKLGHQYPTLIQRKLIPIALSGKDALARARTGSGKTLAYAVPLIQRLMTELEKPGAVTTSVRGLVLVPTAELSHQVAGVLQSFVSLCSAEDITVSCVTDLIPKKSKGAAPAQRLAQPVVLVGTPAGVLDYAFALKLHADFSQRMNQRRGVVDGGTKPLNLKTSLMCVVVDEADLMFSHGFEEDMNRVGEMLPVSTTANYQTILCSATLNDEVKHLSKLLLHKPVLIKLEDDPSLDAELLGEYQLNCSEREKWLSLYGLIKLNMLPLKCLIFTKDVDRAYGLRLFLERFSVSSAVLSPLMAFTSRQKVLDSFNQSVFSVLIATDSAALQETDVYNDEPLVSEDGSEGPRLHVHQFENMGDSSGEEDEKPVKYEVDIADSGAAREEDDDDEDEDDEDDGVHLPTKRRRHDVDKGETRGYGDQFGVRRGLDLQGLRSVVNFDCPISYNAYLHRVGRTGRVGSSAGCIAVTFVNDDDDEELTKMGKITRRRVANTHTKESLIRPLPLTARDFICFKYRVDDVVAGVTKHAVTGIRARELQREALHSSRLKTYFKANPVDAEALEKAIRQQKDESSGREHLRKVPKYMMPHIPSHGMTPTQAAVLQHNKETTGHDGLRTRYTSIHDPLKSLGEKYARGSRTRSGVTQEDMIRKERRMGKLGDIPVEDLPPISRHKIRRINMGHSAKDRSKVKVKKGVIKKKGKQFQKFRSRR